MTVTAATSFQRPRRSAIVALWTCLLLAGVLLLCRRIQGGFEQLPSFTLFIVAALIVQGVCLASGLLVLLTAGHEGAEWPRRESSVIIARPLRLPLIIAIVTIIPLVWAAALWPANQALATGSLLALQFCSLTALFVLGEAARSSGSSAEQFPATGESAASPPPGGVVTSDPVMSAAAAETPVSPSADNGRIPPTATPAFSESADSLPVGEDAFAALHEGEFGTQPEGLPEDDDADVTQWLRRRNSGPGEEMLEGTVTVEFTAGSRQAVVHLAFQPPLCGSPQVECEVLDESDVSLKVAEQQTWGLRIDARRRGDTTEACRVPVGFCVTASAIAPAA